MNGFFLLIFYFFRSLLLRGPVKTIALLLYENKYEKLFNIKTLTIKRSDHKDNYHYQGASYMVLLQLLGHLHDDFKNKLFIDFGCGKGRALFCAEYCGFNKLIGVELDAELINEARDNLRNYSRKRPESSFEFECVNALDYRIHDEAAIFYFFNPFSEKILKQVAQNIRESHQRKERELMVIYLNPKHADVFLDNGFKVLRKEKTNFYTEAIIFTLH